MANSMNGVDPQDEKPSDGATVVFDRLLARYPEVQYRYVHFITEHLADCSRTFDGDLVEMLVLALVGQAYINSFVARAADGVRQPADWISATSVADICGISRETVRRKLKKLQARGWVEQVRGGGWRIAAEGSTESKVRSELAGLDRRGIERLAQLLVQMQPLMK